MSCIESNCFRYRAYGQDQMVQTFDCESTGHWFCRIQWRELKREMTIECRRELAENWNAFSATSGRRRSANPDIANFDSFQRQCKMKKKHKLYSIWWLIFISFPFLFISRFFRDKNLNKLHVTTGHKNIESSVFWKSDIYETFRYWITIIDIPDI